MLARYLWILTNPKKEMIWVNHEKKVRALQKQLKRLSRREQVDEFATKPQLGKVVYLELLELCQELQWEVAKKCGTSSTRGCMNLSLLLLYCAANPERAKEYITLRIDQNHGDVASKGQNFICFNEDGTVILFKDSFKTRSTYLWTQLCRSHSTDLYDLLFRTILLQVLSGKEHTQYKRQWIFSTFPQPC